MRRSFSLTATLLIGLLLLPMTLVAHAQTPAVAGSTSVKAPYNPKPFQDFVVSPSSPIRFLLSERGKAFVRQRGNPGQRDLLRALGEDVAAAPAPQLDTASVCVPFGVFFGDYIGVSARSTSTAASSGRAYTHFTYNDRQGSYNGVAAPEQNNQMARFDY
jgi:hypothetical protein